MKETKNTYKILLSISSMLSPAVGSSAPCRYATQISEGTLINAGK